MTSMSRGSMPAWAIASDAAFTIRDSLVSASSLPNLPWDQPTMQAVMGMSPLLWPYTYRAGGVRQAPLQDFSSWLYALIPPPGYRLYWPPRNNVRPRQHPTPTLPLAPDPGRPAGWIPAGGC